MYFAYKYTFEPKIVVSFRETLSLAPHPYWGFAPGHAPGDFRPQTPLLWSPKNP